MVQPEDVRRVAGLARLSLAADSEAAMVDGLISLLGHFEVLQEVDTTDVEPMSHPGDALGEAADDEVSPFPDPRSTLVPLTSHAREGFFVVPRVLDDAEPA